MSTKSPKRTSWFLVKLVFGDPDEPAAVVRFTDREEPIEGPFGLHASVPKLKVELGSLSGHVERKPWAIEYPAGSVPGTFVYDLQLTDGRAAPPVSGEVREVTIAPGGGGEVLFWHRGSLHAAELNPPGRPNVVRLEFATLKGTLAQSLGVAGLPTCAWPVFGDPKTCDLDGVIDLPSLVETGTITSIDRNILEITGLAAHRDRYWHRGRVSLNGVEIQIRDWKRGTTFQLVTTPPLEWEETITALGSLAVSVTPGCDRRAPTCAAWANLANWMGAGVALPDYNPLFENPE